MGGRTMFLQPRPAFRFVCDPILPGSVFVWAPDGMGPVLLKTISSVP